MTKKALALIVMAIKKDFNFLLNYISSLFQAIIASGNESKPVTRPTIKTSSKT